MKKYDYFQPETLKDAYSLMEKSNGEVKYIAGGTDLLANIKNRLIQPDALISLRRIKGEAGSPAPPALSGLCGGVKEAIQGDMAIKES